MQSLEHRLEQLLLKRPEISAQAAGEKLGISRSWVSQLAKRLKFRLQWVRVLE